MKLKEKLAFEYGEKFKDGEGGHYLVKLGYVAGFEKARQMAMDHLDLRANGADARSVSLLYLIDAHLLGLMGEEEHE